MEYCAALFFACECPARCVHYNYYYTEGFGLRIRGLWLVRKAGSWCLLWCVGFLQEWMRAYRSRKSDIRRTAFFGGVIDLILWCIFCLLIIYFFQVLFVWVSFQFVFCIFYWCFMCSGFLLIVVLLRICFGLLLLNYLPLVINHSVTIINCVHCRYFLS